jgi:hypothetical protein
MLHIGQALLTQHIQEQWAALPSTVRLIFWQAQVYHLALPFLSTFEGCHAVNCQHDEAFDALQARLSALPWETTRILLIDSFENLTAENVLALADWLWTLPAHVRVVLRGKVISRAFLSPLCAFPSAFMPVLPAWLLPDYLAEQKMPLLRVLAFGKGLVFRDEGAAVNWLGQLPKALFFFLVDRGLVSRQAIFSAFWPHYGHEEATNVFHVTKRKVNEYLGADLLRYNNVYYHIDQNVELLYDVQAFYHALQDAQSAPEPALACAHYERALWFYQDDFLPTFDLPWINAKRTELRQTYLEALHALAKLYMAEGRAEEADYLRRMALARPFALPSVSDGQFTPP